MNKTYIVIFLAVILVLIVVWLVNDFGTKPKNSLSNTKPNSLKRVWSTDFSEKNLDIKRWSIIANNNQIDGLNYPSQTPPSVDNILLLKVNKERTNHDGRTFNFKSVKITSNSQFLKGVVVVSAKLNDLKSKDLGSGLF